MNQQSRKLLRTGAAVAAAALAVTGTFAWRDMSQTKISEFEGALDLPDVTLVERFEERSGWSMEDPEVNKDVLVRNTGSKSVYVRVRLSEYLDLSTYDYVKRENGELVRFALDADGNFIRCGEKDPGAYPVGKTWYVEAQGPDFAVTDADHTNRNGQVGKYMLAPSADGAAQVLAGGKKDDPSTYDLHRFTAPLTGGALTVSEYITWDMGAEVRTMAQWAAGDQSHGPFWVLDEDGWAYWGEPVDPRERTELLLDSVTLIKQPGDGSAASTFFYAIKTDLDAVTLEDLGIWTGEAAGSVSSVTENAGKLVAKLKTAVTGVRLDRRALALNKGTAAQLIPTVEPAGAANRNVTWTSSDEAVATVDQTGTVTGVAAGTCKITVTTADRGKMAECTVTVLEPDGAGTG